MAAGVLEASRAWGVRVLSNLRRSQFLVSLLSSNQGVHHFSIIAEDLQELSPCQPSSDRPVSTSRLMLDCFVHQVIAPIPSSLQEILVQRRLLGLALDIDRFKFAKRDGPIYRGASIILKRVAVLGILECLLYLGWRVTT